MRLGVGLGHANLLTADAALRDGFRGLLSDDLAQLVADAGLTVCLVS